MTPRLCTISFSKFEADTLHSVSLYFLKFERLYCFTGITVGDIGPKMSFENIDNGFLMMKNVRVPRENMLARFSQRITIPYQNKLKYKLILAFAKPQYTGFRINTL
ncbi:Peroxisomal acyl-coenzyme A oxidase 2 [Varanus komodoensis]|nr:Peroxisomal acyl-coenzyme A oxidase 2 [Varanus komodoensis]